MPATNDELIRRAIDMVGPDDPEDYRLVPTAHPAALQDRAPVLATLLRSDELQALARRYEADDQRAIRVVSRISQGCRATERSRPAHGGAGCPHARHRRLEPTDLRQISI